MARRWSFFMPPLEHRLLRLLDDWYRGLLTPLGQALFWAATAAGFLLLAGLQQTILLTFGFCAGALLGAVIAGLPFRARLVMQRRLPPWPMAGEVLCYRVLVENRSRRLARGLVVEERGLPPELRPSGAPATIALLPPDGRAEVSLALRCPRRGVFELRSLQAASSFPAGLIKLGGRRRSRERLVVYPRFERLESFAVPRGRNYQPGGIPVASHIGESVEFLGTRDFREGDRLRDIHWPSLARTGRLIVRELQEEYFVRLALVLDIQARSRRDEARFERGISLAAAIADVLARQDYIIDIFAAGPQVYHFQAGRALAHFENILEILSCLEPGDNLNHQALEAAIIPVARQLSAVILVLMDWDESRAALVGLLKTHGVAVRVLSVRPDRPPHGLAADELVEIR